MPQYGWGPAFGPGEADDDADGTLEEQMRRLSRRLRGSASLELGAPRPLTPAQLRQREAVRVRALSLLGIMRPELRDLDALGYGEALEKVCDAIVDLWICEECHEEADRCTCLEDGRWQAPGGWRDDDDDDDEGWDADDDEDDGDGPDGDRPYPFLPSRGSTYGTGR